MKSALTVLALLLPLCVLQAQYATIDELDIDVHCTGVKKAVCRYRLTTTIHSEKGADEADFACSLSNTDQLLHFSGVVCDANGRILRKFKKNDLERNEFSTDLAVDAYLLSLSYVPPVYPVTVTYEWAVQQNNDILEFPSFTPLTSYDVDVRQAHYRLSLPLTLPYRYALQNIDEQALHQSSNDKEQVVDIILKDLPALVQEDYARPIRERLPIARFIPLQFSFFGTEGSLESWQTYGTWVHELLRGRDQLPEDVRRQVRQLVSDCKTDRERVERIYQHLAKTTRYVSIQLGIGGHQPATAADVSRTGFGDCKGLTNYMRALLKEVGIASVYTEIGTNYRHLLPTVPCTSMLNHVILQVPLPDDTLWIECTNPQLPLGYIHRQIAGHDAVMITPSGGQLCRLPVYADSLHTQHTVADIDVRADGVANVQIRQTSRLGQFENLWPLLEQREEIRKRAAGQLFKLPQPVFNNLDLSTQGSTFLIDANVTSQRYATLAGKRLFVPLCPLHQSFKAPSSDERTEPIYIASGYENADTITLHLPEGYVVESLPNSMSLQQPFGVFSQQISLDDGQLRIINRLIIRSGTYPADLHPSMTDFMKEVSAAYTGKAVLCKKE